MRKQQRNINDVVKKILEEPDGNTKVECLNEKEAEGFIGKLKDYRILSQDKVNQGWKKKQ